MSKTQRATAVALFETGYGRDAVARLVGVSANAVRDLHDRWRLHGGDALVSQPRRPAYAYETKREVVQRFLAGESKMALAQALSLSEAISAYTAGSAWVNHDDDGGTIAVGRRADLVVLDRDPFELPTAEIGSCEVVHTYVDGVGVWSGEAS